MSAGERERPAAPGALAAGARARSRAGRTGTPSADRQRGDDAILPPAADRRAPARWFRSSGSAVRADCSTTRCIEGGVSRAASTSKYTAGEILLDPGDRADVVAAIPASATGVLTLWTEDFERTGGGYLDIPTVPVAHFNVTGRAGPVYTIAAAARRCARRPAIRSKRSARRRHAARTRPCSRRRSRGSPSQDIQLTNVGLA